MGSALTSDTGCRFGLKLGDAALAANSIRGAVYHLMSRGDRREEIFRDDLDRKSFSPSLGCGVREDRLAASCLCHSAS